MAQSGNLPFSTVNSKACQRYAGCCRCALPRSSGRWPGLPSNGRNGRKTPRLTRVHAEFRGDRVSARVTTSDFRRRRAWPCQSNRHGRTSHHRAGDRGPRPGRQGR